MRLIIIVKAARRTTGPRDWRGGDDLLWIMVVSTLIAASGTVRGGGFVPWVFLLACRAGMLPVMIPVILPVVAAFLPSVFAALFLAVVVPVVVFATVATPRLPSGDLHQGAQPADDTRGGDQASLLEPVGLLNFGFRLVHVGLL